MKALLTLALLLSSANAFAMVPAQLAKTMSDETVLETLKGQYLTNVEDAPSARCMGCFALRITAEDSSRTQTVYEAHGMDFGGKFRVHLTKME